MTLRGKVALITGGAKRVGRALALGLAHRGCHVAITYRTSAQQAAQTVRSIEARKVRAMAIQVDQRDPAQVSEAVQAVLQKFRRLDVLINNASSFYPTPWADASPRQWDDLLATNLSGPWFFAQAASRFMKHRGTGKIINIVDVAAYLPWTDYLPYCAAKGGLVTLTRGLAKALSPQVQVNAIAPGPILFPPGIPAEEKQRAIRKTLLKRQGSPEDILQAALFFLEGSDFVTGTVLPVDGGRLLA